MAVDILQSYPRVPAAESWSTGYPDVMPDLSTGYPQSCGQVKSWAGRRHWSGERYTGQADSVMPDPCSAVRSGRGGLLLLRNREEAVDTECRDEGRPQRRHPVSRLQANYREGRAEDGNESIDGLEDQGAGHATRLGNENRTEEAPFGGW